MLDLQQIRMQLLQMRQEMLARLEIPVETAKGDDADMAAMSQNKERVLWLTKDAQARLAAIEKALTRIEDGTYGACSSCARPIPEERLTAMPTTLYCVECQSRLARNTRR